MPRPASAIASALVLATASALAGDTDKPAASPCRAELVAETSAVRAGSETTLAVVLVPDAGWHVYWKNPGESGLAPTVDWTLPAGWSAGALQWPAPHRIDTSGIVGYVYEGETSLLVTMKVPASAKPGDVTVSARVRWLVCREVCEPGEAKLELKLAVTEAVPADDAVTAARFAKAHARLPRTLAAGAARLESTKNAVTLSIDAAALPEDVASVDFFPAEELVLDASVAATIEPHWKRTGPLRVRLTPAPRRAELVQRLQGVLVVTTPTGNIAFDIDVRAAEGAKDPGSAGEKSPR